MPELLGVATLVGVVVAVLQLFAVGQQRRREFEYLFVQRYWKIMDELSLEAIECTEPDGAVVASSDRKAVIAFVMLSEDELDLRANRWISADTWELWRAGMSARLSRWPFDAVWQDVRKLENDVDDGQFSRLREAVSRVDGKRLDVPGFEPVRAHNGWLGRVAEQVAAAVRHTKG